MPIPNFNEYGILPEGLHKCTLDEARNKFCTNQRRGDIWNGLERFLASIVHLPRPKAVLLDGSYVTDKVSPGDVDLVVDISSCSTEDQVAWNDFYVQNHDRVKEVFKVDFYTFNTNLGSDFSVFFQYLRVGEALQRGVPPNVRKGILSVQQ